jgi:hypothetical protein
MNNLRGIYENLKQRNPNSSESDLRRQAWVLNDRQMFESTSVSIYPSSVVSGGRTTLDQNDYVDDYVDDYFE